MKKLFFTVILFSAVALSASAQSKKSSEVTICNHTTSTITLADLEKCHMVVPADNTLKVKSFTVSFLVKGADGKEAFVDYKTTGNSFTKDAMAYLTSHKSSISKIVIEEVTAVDGNKNEKKIPGTTFSFK